MRNWILILSILFSSSTMALITDPDCPAGSTDEKCPTVQELSYTPDQAQNAFDRELSKCVDSKDNAVACCSGDSANCSGGSGFGGSGGGDMNQLMKMMMTVSAATLMANSSPGQMSDMSSICNMYSGMNTAGGTVNGNGASSCSSSKTKCDDDCDGLDEHWQHVGIAFGGSVKKYIENGMGGFRRNTRQCEKLSATSQRAQASNMGNMGNVCNQLQQQQPMQLAAVAMPTAPDCTQPYMAQTQVCQVCTTDPSSNACAKAITDSAAQTASFQGSGASANNNNVAVGDSAISKQQAQFASNSNQAPGVPGGTPLTPGGSQPMAPMQQQASAGGPQGRGGPAGTGYDPARTLQGERGGGGGLGGASGTEADVGFQGYSNGTDRGVAGVDLKNYLPGRSLYAGHKVAGVGSANPDINARTTDIFKRISDRFQVICSLNRLVDCVPQQMPKGL